MVRTKAALYNYHYFDQLTDKNSTGDDIQVIRCNIDQCTHTWTLPIDKKFKVIRCVTHMKSHHKDKWVKYDDGVVLI